jgi:hypothetical protein
LPGRPSSGAGHHRGAGIPRRPLRHALGGLRYRSRHQLDGPIGGRRLERRGRHHGLQTCRAGRQLARHGTSAHSPPSCGHSSDRTLLDELLDAFEDVFAAPSGLPRARGRAHHFIPLAHPYSAESVAEAFFAEVVRLHGVPQSMVSDRDPVFTSVFWQELMRLMGTKLHMMTAFHPQSDGQSESANRVIIMYLRCLTGDRPRQWLRWLSWAEYLFNTAYQSSLRDTPFRVVYGRDPPSLRSYEPGDTRLPAIAKSMAERAKFLAEMRGRLEQAQATQKLFYDRNHRAVSYQVGDWALLRLRQRSASSLP